jgi:2-polyprenyl-3-methyl-5-hydroxy-6-metoxy-1,4-benzoquinol methylase
VMFVAPGEWTMWKCGECGSGYLDPRPSPATIGRAYERYPTHAPTEDVPKAKITERFTRAVGNDYRRARFGARLHPRLPIVGRALAAFAPALTRRIDYSYRYLPRRAGRLLDIGCGNGAFLALASNAGWNVAGVEPDPVARGVASAHGDVRELLSDWAESGADFDYVTMSHVIEHVHDPAMTMEMVTRLLAPGGAVYIETPNFNAPTHRQFGAAWRGLEPPRHLALLTKDSIAGLLARAGLEIVRWAEGPDARDFLVEQSSRIAAGLDPYTGQRVGEPVRGPAPEEVSPQGEENEFLILVATKDGRARDTAKTLAVP